MIRIRNASKQNFQEWVAMGLTLWPYLNKKELEKEFQRELKIKKYKTFLAQTENGEYVGFVNLSIRSDYVEGSSTSPVGYIEGIYVKPKYRKQDIAKELIHAGEEWAKKHGCSELGSDTELKNKLSQKVHKKLGFSKAETIVHFLKKIK